MSGRSASGPRSVRRSAGLPGRTVAAEVESIAHADHWVPERAAATLTAVWEHVPDGLLLVDAATGTVVDANPFAEAILARGRDDLVGNHFASLFAREAHDRVAALFRAGAGTPVQNLAAAIAGADGRPVALEISISGTFQIEEKTLTLAALRDVTERQRYVEMRAQAEERERTRAADVEQALEGALASLAATLEKRDPYTAGHERNVAGLALLIASELGLDPEVTRGLYLASLVHDIGKIAIPAEILTKPTRLTAIEYAFVKQHPDVGYEIMGPIPFPWRIAEIVRQHHEYLDGTGYPRGLRGDEILFESRILTVADIVESMSSFRPYHRPIGLEAALSEIRRLAGSKLDASVVAACVRVVERGEFQSSANPAGPQGTAR